MNVEIFSKTYLNESNKSYWFSFRLIAGFLVIQVAEAGVNGAGVTKEWTITSYYKIQEPNYVKEI